MIFGERAGGSRRSSPNGQLCSATRLTLWEARGFAPPARGGLPFSQRSSEKIRVH